MKGLRGSIFVAPQRVPIFIELGHLFLTSPRQGERDVIFSKCRKPLNNLQADEWSGRIREGEGAPTTEGHIYWSHEVPGRNETT